MIENSIPCIRIAHIVGKMMSGGVESVIMNYYRHIDKEKIQFDFIVDADSRYIPKDEIESLGGRILIIPPYQKIIAYHKVLLELFRMYQYKIVHSHINTLNVFPLFAAWRAGIPIRISHSHSCYGKGEFKRNLFKLILRPFSKLLPTHLFACSEKAGSWLFGNKAFYNGQVKIIRNAVDTSLFQFNPLMRQSIRNALSAEDKFVVGHVGRFMPQKNHDFIIDVFSQILNANPNSILILIGDGPLKDDIMHKASALGISDYILFLGVRNDIAKFYSAMDAFLLPSLYEGLPVVASEIQAASLHAVFSQNVTPECKFTDYIEFLSLDCDASVWAERILAYSNEYLRTDTCEFLINAGYDIKTAASELADFYLEVYPYELSDKCYCPCV